MKDDAEAEGSSRPEQRPRGSLRKNRLRHESTETDGSELSATLERAPPDGGWGWVVVGAAFMVNLIADGVTFSFGVFYVRLVKYFGESKSATAWIGSLLAAMPLLSGPIASSLADRFGCRKVTIGGSLLAAIGFLLSSLATSIEMLYLTFGILTGFGLSLCYVAAAVIVAYYFEQRRSFATGLAACGGGIGTFIFAPLTQYLIDEYSWRGTLLILSGAFLHMSVCGALMRDLEWTKKKTHSSSKTIPPSPPSTSEIPEVSVLIKKERLCNSAICIPTFVAEAEAASKHAQHISSRPGEEKEEIMRNYVVTNTAPTLSSWSGLHRHSLTYRGAVLSLKRYRLRPASSCPDIISVTTNERNTQGWRGVLGDMGEWLKGVLEWEHLSNSRFVLFVLSNFLLYMWYDVPYMYLQDVAIESGYSEDLSSYLISIIGLCNMVGNVILGWGGDKDFIDATFIYGVCMFICAISLCLLPYLLSLSFPFLATGVGVFGLTIAANYSLTSVILVRVVSLERFAHAYGFLLLVQGIGNLVGPPIAGVIYDWTGDFSWSFWVAGVGILISSIFILAPKLIQMLKK